MNFMRPSDLPNEDSPDSPQGFDADIEISATQDSHAKPATPAEIHDMQAVGALIRADRLLAGYFPGPSPTSPSAFVLPPTRLALAREC